MVIKIVIALLALALGGDAMAQADAAVTAASTTFSTWLTDNLPVIGGALLGGAAIAVGWKWLKGMFFS